MTFYYSYESVTQKLWELWKKYPAELGIRSLGRTADGRQIWEACIGNRRAAGHILIHGGIHGREYLNSALLLKETEDYLNLCRERKQAGFLECYCIHILPMLNPDGCTISQEGLEGIRSFELKHKIKKMLADNGILEQQQDTYLCRWKANARGVDLNRNFSRGWEEHLGAALPGAEDYRGKIPFSEEETRAVQNLCGKYEFCAAVSYHSSGRTIYWGFGRDPQIREREHRLADCMGRKTGYVLCRAEDPLPKAGGSDYLGGTCSIPAITIETGLGQCPLENGEWKEICQENEGVIERITECCRLWME